MILDIDYSKYQHKLTISYVNERGNKSFLEMNTNRFKTFFFDKDGDYENWDGRKCSQMFTDQPSKFDIKTYINEMSKDKQDLIQQKIFPNLYTFDIEIEYNPAEKPDPRSAKFPITTISICSPNMTTLVLGTKDVGDEEEINQRYADYLNGIEFFGETNLEAKFVYKKFNTEGDMLLYFLKNIVSKCTALAGWNIWGFDWQYISNRLNNFYPDISIKNSSPVFRTKNKNVRGFFNKDEVVRIQIPQHVLLVDMMDIIADHDRVVLPMKESMSLDWIARNSIGAQKVKYTGSLADLYDNDFDTYVLYNAIDSALVQLIDQYFKTTQLIYIYSNITRIPIDQCLGKIGIAEALFFQEFYKDGKVVVWEQNRDRDRGNLQGAYVKQPIPGKYNFAMCFDFAGLYPSQIMTCNISAENFIWPEEGGWAEDELNIYKSDPSYFVSVNNNVYKNDKDYVFKRVQKFLKGNRDMTKYLAKDLNAQVMSVIDDIIDNKEPMIRSFSNDIMRYMEDTYKLDYDGIINYDNIKELKHIIHNDIMYKVREEQAFKLIGNSCYGGTSNVAFYWFNIGLANDITGESRNLIHMMDDLSNKVLGPKFLENTELHEKLGISINRDIFLRDYENNPDVVCYGDTDSCYVVGNHIVNSLSTAKDMSDYQKTEFCVKLANEYLNPLFNKTLDDYFESRHVKSVHNFELETVAKTGIWIDVKKRYAQSILWQDGRYFDEPKIKIKGLEVVKSSAPAYARKILKDMMEVLLLDDGDNMSIINKLNNISQKALMGAPNQNIDDICESISVNGYAKSIINDSSGPYPTVVKGTSFNVSALALYNWIVNTKGYPDDNIYGGKVKIYIIDDKKRKRSSQKDRYFAYMADSYPSWANQEAPINYPMMHNKTILGAINRILEAIGMQSLRTDGSLPISLF